MVVSIIILLAILALVGVPALIVIFRFLNSPIIAGQIPVWALVLVVLLAFYIYKNRYKWGLARPKNPSYQQMRY